MVKKSLLIFADRGVIVTVAHDAINLSGDIAATNIADYCAVAALHVGRMLTKPIVVFDGGLNATILRYLDAHPLKERTWIAKILLIFGGCTFPEMQMEGLLADDLRSG